MDEYYAKLKEYLKMDTEISCEEFARYYTDFMEKLKANYPFMERDALLKGRYICSILQANSWERAKRKNSEAKKYKKIAEKTQFWAGAIKYRLQKEGMTVQEMEEAEKAFHDESE